MQKIQNFNVKWTLKDKKFTTIRSLNFLKIKNMY
jgi:hypothetical protein